MRSHILVVIHAAGSLQLSQPVLVDRLSQRRNGMFFPESAVKNAVWSHLGLIQKIFLCSLFWTAQQMLLSKLLAFCIRAIVQSDGSRNLCVSCVTGGKNAVWWSPMGFIQMI